MKDDPVKLLQKIISDIHRDYEDEVATAIDNREAKLRELREIFEGEQKSPPISDPSIPRKSGGRRAPVIPKPGYAQIVRNIIAETDRKFDKNYIERQMKKKHPDMVAKLRPVAVPNILRRLAKAGMISTVEHGTGRKPSTYRKTVHQQTGFPKNFGEKGE